MRKAYEFSKMKGRRNPYAKLLKKPVTLAKRKSSKAFRRALGRQSVADSTNPSHALRLHP